MGTLVRFRRPGGDRVRCATLERGCRRDRQARTRRSATIRIGHEGSGLRPARRRSGVRTSDSCNAVRPCRYRDAAGHRIGRVGTGGRVSRTRSHRGPRRHNRPADRARGTSSSPRSLRAARRISRTYGACGASMGATSTSAGFAGHCNCSKKRWIKATCCPASSRSCRMPSVSRKAGMDAAHHRGVRGTGYPTRPRSGDSGSESTRKTTGRFHRLRPPQQPRRQPGRRYAH